MSAAAERTAAGEGRQRRGERMRVEGGQEEREGACRPDARLGETR